MTLEVAMVAVLKPLVNGRVFPDVAPEASPLPRLVYQQVGGRALSYVGNELPDLENARIQIAAWARTRAEAKSLIKQAEAALIQTEALQVEPAGASISHFEEDTGLYGSYQDFSIWSDR